MKKIYRVLILLILFCCCSCFAEDRQQEAKDEFSQYYNGEEEVVIKLWDYYYFENHTFDCNTLYGDEGSNLADCTIVKEQKIYYFDYDIVEKDFNYKKYYFQVFSCDYYGENRCFVDDFVFDAGEKKVDYGVSGYYFYLKYKKNNMTYIDRYNVNDNTFENIEVGQSLSIYDYINKKESSEFEIELTSYSNSYSCKKTKKNGWFKIKNKETSEERVIDDEYLKSTLYLDSMELFGYEPISYTISKGHILLAYVIAAGDGWNYPQLVFEYDFASNSLEYKLLAFPYDKPGVEIIYIG